VISGSVPWAWFPEPNFCRAKLGPGHNGDAEDLGTVGLDGAGEGGFRVGVEVSVDESLASTLSLGAKAHVAVESAGREEEGQVTEVVPALDPVARTFLVKIALQTAAAAGGTPSSTLRPGMFARVRFPIGFEDRLTVPSTAIRPAGELDRLFVLEGGKGHLRLVTLGQRQAANVEVLAGLDPGEVALADPPAGLLDGAAVEAAP